MTTLTSTVERRYLRLLDAAAYLGQTERFMRSLVARRRIRYYKMGRYVCFAVADLEAFADRGRVEPSHLTGLTHG